MATAHPYFWKIIWGRKFPASHEASWTAKYPIREKGWSWIYENSTRWVRLRTKARIQTRNSHVTWSVWNQPGAENLPQKLLITSHFIVVWVRKTPKIDLHGKSQRRSQIISKICAPLVTNSIADSKRRAWMGKCGERIAGKVQLLQRRECAHSLWWQQLTVFQRFQSN